MTLRISVALCTRNGENYIEAQLLSIFNQSVLPDELVISDDDSSDSTMEVIEAVIRAAMPSSIRVLIQRHRPALGVAENFESAIRATGGDLIVLSDQDDVWHLDRIRRSSYELSRRPEIDLIFSNARLVDSKSAVSPALLLDVLEVSNLDRLKLHRGEAFDIFIKRNIATGATVMFRRSLLSVALPFPLEWIHDEWIATVAACIGGVDLIDEPLIDYRQHDSNQIGVTHPTLRRKVRRTFHPRGDRNARLARLYASLETRLDMQILLDPVRVVAVAEKARFELERSILVDGRIGRVLPIVRLARRGWYSRYSSQGRLDILRDFLQSHRA